MAWVVPVGYIVAAFGLGVSVWSMRRTYRQTRAPLDQPRDVGSRINH